MSTAFIIAAEYTQMRRLNLGLLLLLLATSAGFAQRDGQRSVWDGVYTVEQAKRGEKLYAQHCAACHGADLEGVGIIPPLVGAGYIKGWDGKTVGDMVDHQQKTMPTDDPKKLTRAEHVDVLAYLLSVNEFPAGTGELPQEAERLSAIRVESTRPKK